MFLLLLRSVEETHYILCIVWKKLGTISCLSFKWFESYLSNRMQYTVFNSISSSFKEVCTGVPQGSILGPLLFLIYVNDIVNSCPDFTFILYADDTTILASDNDINTLYENVNRNLSNIANWFECNKLSLNVDKTNYILFKQTRENVQFTNDIKINGKIISRCKYIQFLGITLDENINWREHVDNVCRKVAQFVGVLNRLKSELPPFVLLSLYNAFILPHLSYCNTIWANTYTSRLDKLFKLQKKAIRNVTKSNYLAHTSQLFKRLNTLKLQDINKVQITSLMQRFHTNTLSPYIMDMFTLNSNIHPYNTRSSNKIHQWKFRNTRSKQTLRYTGPALWNAINPQNFNTQNNNSFKKQYKKHVVLQY